MKNGRRSRRAATSSGAWEKRLVGRGWRHCWAIQFSAQASAGRKFDAGVGAHRLTDFAPKAKRAIYLFMSGAPSQMDLWDYKPTLATQFDKDLPDSIRGNQALTGMTAGQARFPIAPSHWQFAQQGKSGRYVSELLPWSGKLVDDITLIHTMQTDAINHEPAILLMNTGNMNPGKPSLGSWLAYGLGQHERKSSDVRRS